MNTISAKYLVVSLSFSHLYQLPFASESVAGKDYEKDV